jgi:hypothetical protein
MADKTALILAMQNTTQEIQNATSDIQNDTRSTRIDDLRETIYRWLSAPDPSVNHNEACNRRHTDTGTWFVSSQTFDNWKRYPNSFLWLHGIPGCGKTILSSTIIQNLLDIRILQFPVAVVYFYFSFSDVEKQSYEKMIRSFIMQLSV